MHGTQEDTYSCIYVGTDPQAIVANIVNDYFNKVGQIIITAREEERYVRIDECDHAYTKSMLKIGLFTEMPSESFNSGPTSYISRILFNEPSMKYHDYFLRVSRELMHSYEELPTFASEYSQISKIQN
jgi:hypothetical protein